MVPTARAKAPACPPRPRLASVLAAANQLPRQRSRREIAPPVSQAVPLQQQEQHHQNHHHHHHHHQQQQQQQQQQKQRQIMKSQTESVGPVQSPSDLVSQTGITKKAVVNNTILPPRPICSSTTTENQKMVVPPRPNKQVILAALEKRQKTKEDLGVPQVETHISDQTNMNVKSTRQLLRVSSLGMKKVPPPIPVGQRENLESNLCKSCSQSCCSSCCRSSSSSLSSASCRCSCATVSTSLASKGSTGSILSTMSSSSSDGTDSVSSIEVVSLSSRLAPPQPQQQPQQLQQGKGSHRRSYSASSISTIATVSSGPETTAQSTSNPSVSNVVAPDCKKLKAPAVAQVVAVRQPKTLARARVAYSNKDIEGHLSFSEGQIIEILDKCGDASLDSDSGPVELWKGRAICDGKVLIGFFPSIYVALIKSSSSLSGQAAQGGSGKSSTNNISIRLNLDGGSGKGSGSFGSGGITVGAPKSAEGSSNACMTSLMTPAARGISGEILAKERHCNTLFHALVEVVHTELRHVSDLRTVHQIFIQPFEALFGAQLTRQVFSDWVPLLRVHEQVLVKLFEGLPTLEMLSESFSAAARDPVVQQTIRSSAQGSSSKSQNGVNAGASSNKPNVSFLFTAGPAQNGFQAENSQTATAGSISSKLLSARSSRMHSFLTRTLQPASARGSFSTQTSKSDPDSLCSPERGEEMLRAIKSIERVHKEHLIDFMFLDNKQIDRWSQILADTTVSLCATLAEMSDWLKLCIPCVVNQPNAVKSLMRSRVAAIVTTPATTIGGSESCRQVTPKLFIRQQGIQERSKLNNLDLQSFLIKPMQRITKYPLLMRELVKLHEKAANPIPQGAAQVAFEKMSNIANKVNEIMKQHQDDHSQHMAELSQQLRPRDTVQRLGLFDGSKRRKLYRFGKCSFQTITTTVSQRDLLGNSGNFQTASSKSKASMDDHADNSNILSPRADSCRQASVVESKTATQTHEPDSNIEIPQTLGGSTTGKKANVTALDISTCGKSAEISTPPASPAVPSSWSSSSSSAASHLLAKHEGVRTGACYAMLFTSALVFAVKTLNKWKTKTKYHIVKVIEVQNITSVSCMEGCLSVRTACSNVLVTPLEDDVLRWQVDLEDCKRVVAADRERQDAADAQKQHKKKHQQQQQQQQQPALCRGKSLDTGSVARPRPNSAELYRSFMQELQTNEMFATAS